MRTTTSIRRTSRFRLQAQMAEAQLARALRNDGISPHISATRAPRGLVTHIRRWQDGQFVSIPLYT